MANPAFRAATTARNGNVTCIISSPSTTVVGDVLTAVFSGYSAGTYSPTPTLPSGWTLLNSEAQTGAGYTVIDYTARFVATAAGTVYFTFGSSLPSSSSGSNAAIIACYNQDPSTPIDDSQVATVPNGTTATSPAATATVANDLILCIYADGGNTGAIPSLPSGLTSALAYNDSTNGFGLRVGYTTLTASGTTPTYTSTYGESVDPASGVFGTMFTVLVKAVSSGTTITASESEAASAVDSPSATTSTAPTSAAIAEAASGVDTASVVVITAATQSEAGSAADTITTGGNEAASMAETASAVDASSSAQTVTAAQLESASAADVSSIGGSWAVEQIYQTTQKWHIGSYTPATLSITCNQGDSLIVFSNQWQSNNGATFIAAMSPGSLTTIYDPEASYNGTAEPVYAQALVAFNLNAGTYTITPPPLGGPGGDGDTYVLRISGVSGLRTFGHANEGGGSTTTGNYTSSTATLQAVAVAGDLLCAIGGTDNNTVTTTLTVATPTGWTNAAKQTDGTNSPPSSVDYTTAVGGVQSAAYTWPDFASPVGQSIILALIPVSGGIIESVTDSESASASDTSTESTSTLASQADAGSAADLSTSAANTTAAQVDTASASDVPASSETTTAAQADAGAAADSSAQTGTTTAAQTEAGSASDAQTASGSTTAAQLEVSSAIDAPQSAIGGTSAVNEAATGVDTQASAESVTAAQVDAGAATDSTSTGNVSAHGLTETASATDAIASLILSISQIGESATAAAVAAAQTHTTAAANEVGNAADLTAAAQAGVSSVSENAPAIDAPASSEQVTAASSESGTATDQSTGGNAITAATAEAANATDSLSATLALLSAAQEIAAATDALTYAASTLTDAAEAANAQDLIATLAQLSQSITEAANAQDATAILSTLSEIAEWQYYAAQAARYFYAGMPFRSFYALCTSNMAPTIPSAIDPSETKVLTLDATADLPAGVTLTGTPTVEVVVTRGTDPNASGIVKASAINTTPVSVTNASGQVVTIAPGLCVQVEVSGCLDGCWYEIRVTCSTTDPKNVEVLKAILTCTAS